LHNYEKYIAVSLVTAVALTSAQAKTNIEDLPLAKTIPVGASTAVATVTLEDRVKSLEEKLAKSDKKYKKLSKKLNVVKTHDAFDNIKFSIDFRNSVDSINYKYHDYGTLSGTEASNDALLASRLYLNMKSKPLDNLMFSGQIAMYGTWGGSHLSHDISLKDWSESSKVTDAIFRIRQAYFVWTDTLGDDGLPYAFSVGRRLSTDGFLANHRENYDKPGSPLGHITNMEVNGAMLKLNLEEYVLPGTFVKFVYGRAHTGGIDTLNDVGGYAPYAQDEVDLDENVDFFVVLGSLYNDGQYNLMYENATIFNTKGARTGTVATGAAFLDEDGKNKSLDAGIANLTALSLQVDGIGDEINDFLDSTTAFASIAMTNYDPDSGHQLLGSSESEMGTGYWIGATIPDMITDDGKFGFEYNHGSQYWTPITWAEDTAIGSKVAVRGSAYEAYWNFNLFGVKNLASQIRYTHIQHDYTPSIRCAGWVKPAPVDIEADDLRFFIRYSY